MRDQRTRFSPNHKSRPTMKPFLVSYTEPNDTVTQYLRCDAENANHAAEQCVDAYPTCTITDVAKIVSVRWNAQGKAGAPR